MDFMPGDPASHVIGKPEEKPARRHGRQKPKPKARPLQFEERLLRDIQERMARLAPILDEVPRLEQALENLKGIEKNHA